MFLTTNNHMRFHLCPLTQPILTAQMQSSLETPWHWSHNYNSVPFLMNQEFHYAAELREGLESPDPVYRFGL